MTTSHPVLPHPALPQLDRLLAVGLDELSGRSAEDLRQEVAALPALDAAVLAVHPALVPASRLAPLLQRAGRPGFVVLDLTDLDEFVPVPGVDVPDRPLYLLTDLERGDEMLNWSPEEAAPVLAERGRSPLTISEGISWLLQDPTRLEPNRCFMCIGSRKPKPGFTQATHPASKGYDARTPAIWISSGTGRDGRERKDAPKVGWCWWRNRHTWLGFASAGGRI